MGRYSKKVTCPCHNDDKPSMSITLASNGKILIHCHAGCRTEDILESVGLTFEDIGSPPPEKKQYGWRSRLLYGMQQKYGEGVGIHDQYDYTDENGVYLYSKIRFAGGDIKGKEVRFYWIDTTSDTYETASKHYGDGKVPHTLYNLPKLLESIKEGYPVYVVEGEKDVETLRKIGYVATTSGGSRTWYQEYGKYFVGARVCILPDNDRYGEEYKDEILKSIKYTAYASKVVMTSKRDKGDVSDYLEEHSAEELKQLISGEEWHPGYYVGDGNGFKYIKADCLQKCVGKVLNYLIVRNPADEKDSIYLYRNGVYEECSKQMLKAQIRMFIPVGEAKDKYLNETLNLLLASDQDSICRWEDINSNEDLINVKNGLVNLKNRELEKHTPDYKCTLQLDVSYNPDNNSMPVFRKFINDLCSNHECEEFDSEKAAILQEYMGLTLSNVRGSRSKKALVLLSLLGNTGKSQYLSLITRFLQKKTANIPLKTMGSGDGSRFALSSLIGNRAVIVGDQSNAAVEDSSTFKQITGGDLVRVEVKGKTPIDYPFYGTILVACNDLPVFKDDKGDHLYERLLVVPLEHSIPPDERDSTILDKIWSEREAVFNWALEGLYRFIDNGFKFSKCHAVDNAIRDYRKNVDTLFKYLEDGQEYIKTGNPLDKVKKTDFDTRFIEWAERNEYTPMKKRNIPDALEKHGVHRAKSNFADQRGVEVYVGVKEYDPLFEPAKNTESDLFFD